MINTASREIAVYILVAVAIGLLAYLSFAVGEIHQTLKPEPVKDDTANQKVDALIGAINRGELLQLLISQQAQLNQKK